MLHYQAIGTRYTCVCGERFRDVIEQCEHEELHARRAARLLTDSAEGCTVAV